MHARWWFRYPATLIASLAVACVGDEAALEVSINEFGMVTRELYRISIADGHRTWQLSGADVTAESVRLKTATSGTLEVAFRLVTTVEGEVGSGQLELDLRPDWFWAVTFRPDDQDPTEGCFGCLEHFVFPLSEAVQTSSQDSMHVVISGNSISNPVVY